MGVRLAMEVARNTVSEPTSAAILTMAPALSPASLSSPSTTTPYATSGAGTRLRNLPNASSLAG